MEIAIIGAGYVGLTTAACLADIGHQVYCADNNIRKLDTLLSGQMPFFEPHLAPIVTRSKAAGRLEFTSPEEAVDRARAIFICVGTPPLENGEADLSAVEHLARIIAQRAHGYRLVVEKSTVPVQTGRQLQKHLRLYNTNALDYEVVSNPEFLREGSAVEDFFHPDRIVVGVESPRAAKEMEQIYRTVLDQTFTCPVHAVCPRDPGGVKDNSPRKPAFLVTDINSAELVKHASNSFLAMKISFINLMADLCEASGADIGMVAEGIGLDRRIGPAFLSPGLGFGGFCLPKDLQAFIRIGEKLGCDFTLLRETEKINLQRTGRFLEKVRQELWVLRGKKIAVWGLAFKPGTDDVRYSPALDVIRCLLAWGAEVQAYDPQASANARLQIQELICCSDLYEAAHGVEAILVLTEWEEFREADWTRLRAIVNRPLVIDGRNFLSRDDLTAQGFHYVDIGRRPPQEIAVPMRANQ
jgi:UDPglucose 6-dehydrogenase